MTKFERVQAAWESVRRLTYPTPAEALTAEQIMATEDEQRYRYEIAKARDLTDEEIHALWLKHARPSNHWPAADGIIDFARALLAYDGGQK